MMSASGTGPSEAYVQQLLAAWRTLGFTASDNISEQTVAERSIRMRAAIWNDQTTSPQQKYTNARALTDAMNLSIDALTNPQYFSIHNEAMRRLRGGTGPAPTPPIINGVFKRVLHTPQTPIPTPAPTPTPTPAGTGTPNPAGSSSSVRADFLSNALSFAKRHKAAIIGGIAGAAIGGPNFWAPGAVVGAFAGVIIAKTILANARPQTLPLSARGTAMLARRAMRIAIATLAVLSALSIIDVGVVALDNHDALKRFKEGNPLGTAIVGGFRSFNKAAAGVINAMSRENPPIPAVTPIFSDDGGAKAPVPAAPPISVAEGLKQDREWGNSHPIPANVKNGEYWWVSKGAVVWTEEKGGKVITVLPENTLATVGTPQKDGRINIWYVDKNGKDVRGNVLLQWLDQKTQASLVPQAPGTRLAVRGISLQA